MFVRATYLKEAGDNEFLIRYEYSNKDATLMRSGVTSSLPVTKQGLLSRVTFMAPIHQQRLTQVSHHTELIVMVFLLTSRKQIL